MTTTMRRALLLGMALGGMFTAAQAAVNPPILMTPQGVEYMCGGNAKSEAAFMERVSPRWAATFAFSQKKAQGEVVAVSGVKVAVRSSFNRQVVMETTADAPYLLSRLAPGTYLVEATYDGLTLIQPIAVNVGMPARAEFVWPSNLGMPVQMQAGL